MDAAYIGTSLPEMKMTLKLRLFKAPSAVAFPPEAAADFGDVEDSVIAAWREKLNARFAFGTGKLRSVEEPKVTA